eukprot:TRINITY_DN5897_c0_g1_i2.p1 TRINITY_DN5897_c0_g1~~TRINITY_DN5897_c0_g1_i2.p1  ORF type:complete len:652 (-),score=137.32 TRINITY_DN5897_c0_g1_i2:104-2059(-)
MQAHHSFKRIEVLKGHLLPRDDERKVLVSSLVSSTNENNQQTSPSFNPSEMNAFLCPDYRDLRKLVELEFAKMQEGNVKYKHLGLSLEENRKWSFEISQKSFKLLTSLTGLSMFEVNKDFRKVCAALESALLFDASAPTYMGVQMTLFGGSLLNLGTEYHHKTFLPHVLNYGIIGCFALTELGHGSNVRKMETTITYDRKNKEFILNSPTLGSQKYLIGAAAQWGTHAVVFGQLYVDDQWCGLHGIVVEIRKKVGDKYVVCDGVKVGDCGPKMGLQGVDNGMLKFSQVRVPQSHLLDKFGGLDKNGNYTSEISDPNKRFAKNLAALVAARYGISGGSAIWSKMALGTAVKYSLNRVQFGSTEENEEPIIHLLTHQRRLFPYLAGTYALHFANDHFKDVVVADPERKSKDLHLYASALKVYGSWFLRDLLQVCRECCGGNGFLSVNLIGPLIADTHVYATFDGDNHALIQQVVKEVLLKARNSDVQSKVFAPIEPKKGVRDLNWLMEIFSSRTDYLTVRVISRLSELIGEGQSTAVAWNSTLNLVVPLGMSYAEQYLLTSFFNAISKCTNRSLVPVLSKLFALFGLWIIERDAWFLRANVITKETVDIITDEINVLCKEILPECNGLVDSFYTTSFFFGDIANEDWANKYKL